MFDRLRSLFAPARRQPFLCGWAMRQSALRTVADEDMSQDLGALLELHGARLEYKEMIVLSELFAHWAKTEDVTEDQRDRLAEQARSFERLADFCGPDWVPRDRNDQEIGLLRFVAQDALADDTSGHWRLDQPRRYTSPLEALAARMTVLLELSANPDVLAVKIRERAVRAGIVSPDTKLRSLPYAAFVRDLLLDNLQAAIWVARTALDTGSIPAFSETDLLNAIA